jgi:hypothetical protein
VGGILALARVAPLTLLPVSVVVLGACYLLTAGAIQFFLDPATPRGETSEWPSATGAGGAEILIGLGAMTLGVLALAGLYPPLLLSQIGVLALGAGVMMRDVTVAIRTAARHSGS